MEVRLAVLILALIGSAISQKLFFKSLKEDLQEKEEKLTLQDSVVPCPGGKSACSDGSTCCMLITRAFGCCALPNATCCLDGKHCCPKGLKCDLGRKACISANEDIVIPWTETQSTKEINQEVVKAVQCDNFHECPTGNTCCKLPTGQWGCCPKPNAVCCDDHIHCCPQGSKCDTTTQQCHSGDLKIDWFMKKPAVKTYKQDGEPVTVIDLIAKEPNIRLDAVKCDERYKCQDGQTCCKLASGSWGCCPIPKAVCCSDHVHCCPHDTTCDVSSGKCNQGNIQMDWFVKKAALPTATVKCDTHSECKVGQTCCKLASGSWGCCPIPKAVCCSDHVHCCPHDTTCDVSSGKCNQGNIQMDWFVKKAALPTATVKCDEHSECKVGQTCCKLASGSWGCCPIPKAVCCSDHVHCCPENTKCDVSSGKCERGNIQVDWYEKEAALTVGKVKCDDLSYCEDGKTCCKTASGQWGCCPLPKAVCCNDHLHCCPEGTTCDVAEGKCNRGNLKIDWIPKQKSQTVFPVRNTTDWFGKVPSWNVMCDATHYCQDGNTCCVLASGQWGCCPLPNAVCCDDHVHCCPSGDTCDVSSGKCSKQSSDREPIDWVEKVPALRVGNVPCDATHYCQNGQTCCKLSTGQWGCCPLPNAVCCSDGEHCCPSGDTCDVSSGKCNQQSSDREPIDWVEKVPALRVGNVPCDATHYCQKGQTCCKLSTGQWGCCPLPNAVCCSDGEHCCPSGDTCDVSSGKCNQKASDREPIDWLEKVPALRVGDVPCDDTHYCPNGKTCCKLSTGQWGCCPLPNAVCCSDGEHCCPSGDTCDVSSGKCNQKSTDREPIDWVKKVPALRVGDVPYYATHYCPDGKTCCKLSSGQWGCCPLPNAVCCSDHVHCCPSGTTCDVSSGKCNQGLAQIDWFTKEEAQVLTLDREPVGNELQSNCDEPGECPPYDTCCKTNTGVSGCCPLPNAVCCSDGQHCCPEGYVCDTSVGTCSKGDMKMDWYDKSQESSKKDKASADEGKDIDENFNLTSQNVICDNSMECPPYHTCCKQFNGEWGCCPLPMAECCSDGEHCCPNGYICNAGTCSKGNMKTEWYTKTPAIPTVHKPNAVICPDGSECRDGQTCCPMYEETYGCCPLPNAVCCSDGEHCCPQGYECDVSHGTCIRDMHTINWSNTTSNKRPPLQAEKPISDSVVSSDQVFNGNVIHVERVGEGRIVEVNKDMEGIVDNGVVPCQGSTQGCNDGQTCCEDNKEGFKCCPFANGVCCPDHKYCCSHGYICDEEPGICRIPETKPGYKVLNRIYAKEILPSK